MRFLSAVAEEIADVRGRPLLFDMKTLVLYRETLCEHWSVMWCRLLDGNHVTRGLHAAVLRMSQMISGIPVFPQPGSQDGLT